MSTTPTVDSREGHALLACNYWVPCERIEIFESAHPMPDAESVEAAQRMLATVGDLTADDVVLCLMSGGASSLLVAPLEGLSGAKHQRDELRPPPPFGNQWRTRSSGAPSSATGRTAACIVRFLPRSCASLRLAVLAFFTYPCKRCSRLCMA